jgi:hypothetical protein
MNYSERAALDRWLTNAPDPAEFVDCPDCDPDGCTACDGDGLNHIHFEEGDPFIDDNPCEECGGSGIEVTDCDFCLGEGEVSEDALRMRDYDRAEAERADAWRSENELD